MCGVVLALGFYDDTVTMQTTVCQAYCTNKCSLAAQCINTVPFKMSVHKKTHTHTRTHIGTFSFELLLMLNIYK